MKHFHCPALPTQRVRSAAHLHRLPPGVAATLALLVLPLWLAWPGTAMAEERVPMVEVPDGGGGAVERLRLASKESPYVNGLGMRFVPVPGLEGVWMSVWETRVRDYAAYAGENRGVNEEWKDYEYEGHAQAPDHPVVKMTWQDARAFCEWLNGKEKGLRYRLPTDHEWSVAVGIGDREDPALSPSEKPSIEGIYPWGKEWPPPPGAGNYHGAEGAGPWNKIEGYRDGHPFTAPVGSYRANAAGIYDLGGNVWEWCEDRHVEDKDDRVLRGGSWCDYTEIDLRSSFRYGDPPAGRYGSRGFRVVVVVGGGG